MPLVNYAPSTDPLQVVHKDDQLLVIDKPSGLLSVPGKALEHRDCLETRVRDAYPDALLVHRLDMDTSGIMIFARTKAAQRHLGSQFQKRQTQKQYEARVAGVVAADEGEIDLPLIVDWPNRPIQKVCHDTGKPSQTRWQVVNREDDATRVTLFPKTGRTHQLRVHMMAIGHTILGDDFYGDPVTFAAADRLQLHALQLRLRHPDGGAWMEFNAPVPF